MTSDDQLRLIYDLYWVLVNHPPCPEIFQQRTKVLNEAYQLVKFMEEPYAIPDED